MELTADRLVIIGRGRLIADTAVGEFIARAGSANLEEAYFGLTDDVTEYKA
jgi:ABC-2 type transport system ATP-binding protein